MLKEKNNCNYGIGVLILSIVLIGMFPFLLILLFVMYFKGNIDIEGIIKKLGLYKCFGIERIKKILENSKSKIIYKDNKKDYYHLKVEQAEKIAREEEVKKMKELKQEAIKGILKSKNKKSRVIDDIKSEKRNYSIGYKKNSYINKKPLVKKQKKEKKYDFFGGKSIWDDYESIEDKINNKY